MRGVESQRVGEPAQRLASVAVEAILGGRVVRDAPHRECQQCRVLSQLGDAVHAAPLEQRVLGLRRGNAREVTGEQDARGIGFEGDPGVAAVIDRAGNGVEARSDRDQRARVERLLVAEGDVVWHRWAP